jgi:hypothetical protein
MEGDVEFNRLFAECRSAVLLSGRYLAVYVYQALPFRGDRACAWVRACTGAVGGFWGAKVSVDEVDDGGGRAAFAENVVLLRVICACASWYCYASLSVVRLGLV